MSVSCAWPFAISKDCTGHYKNHIWSTNPGPDPFRWPKRSRPLGTRLCPWKSGCEVSQCAFCIKMCKLSPSGRFFGVSSKSFVLFYLGIDLVFTHFIGFKPLCKGPRDVSMRGTVFNTWQWHDNWLLPGNPIVSIVQAFTPRFHISEMFLSKILTVFAVSCLNVNVTFI